jgi:hypothetical protein
MNAIASPDDNEALFLRAVEIRNAESPGAYVLCRECRRHFHHSESHWVYGKQTCDTCGTTLIEGIVREFLHAPTHAAASRALRPLERLSGRRRRSPSCAAIKRAAAKRLEAGRLAKALELDINFVIGK